MSANYCIEEKRIYATGESNGGGFVDVLACSPEYGNRFAAFAPVIGAFYSDVNDQSMCNLSRSRTPILEIHGYLDANFDCEHASILQTEPHWCQIPYNGTVGRDPPLKNPLPRILDWLARWATRNGCAQGAMPDLEQREGYAFVKYDCGGIDRIVQHYRVDNWGHKWPNPEDGAVIDAGKIVMDFFSRHRLA